MKSVRFASESGLEKLIQVIRMGAWVDLTFGDSMKVQKRGRNFFQYFFLSYSARRILAGESVVFNIF